MWCLLLKRTVYLNASRQTASLANFTVGRLLLMPTVKEGKQYLIDADAARYFFLTEHYYPALRQTLTENLDRLHSVLSRPSYARYITADDLPPRVEDPLPAEAPLAPLP